MEHVGQKYIYREFSRVQYELQRDIPVVERAPSLHSGANIRKIEELINTVPITGGTYLTNFVLTCRRRVRPLTTALSQRAAQ